MASKKDVDPLDGAAAADRADLSELPSLRALRALITTLRGEGGCPWDRKQTPNSVTPYLLEEAYEFIDAVETGDIDAVREELGDVLFQVLFITHLYEERGDFDLATVAEQNRIKMTRRHPHVFGDETITTTGEVKQRWAEIKVAESGKGPPADDAHELPANLPALLKACRYFDRLANKPHPKVTLALAKAALVDLEAELAHQPIEDFPSSASEATIAEAAGDALLHLVHAVRRMNLHPETLLAQALRRQLSKT